MTSVANEAGTISILGAGETGQNRLINVQIWGVPSSVSPRLGASNNYG